MCGSFALSAKTKDIEKLKSLNSNNYEFEPKTNIFPFQKIPIIKNTSKNELSEANWGLIPSWAKDKKIAKSLFNARAETINEKPSFRNSFKNKRCLIPATQFYEWKQVPNSKYKEKYIISVLNTEIFFFAGLWDIYYDENKLPILSTTIITTEPNTKMSAIHNRMPVILLFDTQDLWLENGLTNDELKSFLKPIDDDFILINKFNEDF